MKVHPPIYLLAIALFSTLPVVTFAQSPAPAADSADAKTPNKWEKDIAAFEAKDREAMPPKNAVLFVGSSSIRRWTDVATAFPHHQVINRGFGGSMISDSVMYADRIVTPYSPRKIFFYAGSNDINAKKPAETVAKDFFAFAEKVHAKLPEIEIAFISIQSTPKRFPQIEEVKKVNSLVAEYCKKTPKMQYIDVFPTLLGPDGKPKEEFFVEDGIHMKPAGYKIWVDILTPLLPPADKS